MGNLPELIKNEPVLISGLVQAIIVLLLSFGVHLSADQIGAIMALVAVLLAIGARMYVTPTRKLDSDTHRM